MKNNGVRRQSLTIIQLFLLLSLHLFAVLAVMAVLTIVAVIAVVAFVAVASIVDAVAVAISAQDALARELDSGQDPPSQPPSGRPAWCSNVNAGHVPTSSHCSS